jgi:hypothetical protein
MATGNLPLIRKATSQKNQRSFRGPFNVLYIESSTDELAMPDQLRRDGTSMWWQRLFGQRQTKKPDSHRRPALTAELLESRRLPSTNALGIAFPFPGFGPTGGFANVTYHGGPLLRNVQIQAVFDGQVWSTNSNLQQLVQQTDGFVQYFVTSPYVDVLKQYNVSDGTFAGNDIVADGSRQTISDGQIQSILNSEISSGKLSAPSANSLYIFFTAPGTVVTDGGQNSVHDFAGYHSVFTDEAGASVYDAVIPSPTGNVANVPLTTSQQETVILSHEISEAMTDPDTQTGWFDRRLGEIGDIAAGQVGQLGGYEVQAVWSQVDGQIVLPSGASNSSVQVNGVPVHATAGQAFTSIVATIIGADSSATAGSFAATIDWGNGNTSPGSISADSNGGFDVSGTNSYAHSGSYTITVTVKDSSGATVGAATTRAHVFAAPSGLAARGTIIDATAGVAFNGTVATFTSSTSGATAANFNANIDWGDGTMSTGAIIADSGGGFDIQGTHTYAAAAQSDQSDPWGSFEHEPGHRGSHFIITVMITDNQDNSTATAISLARVAPGPSAITVTGQNFTVPAGQSFSGVVATFTDTNTSAAASDFTATIRWGDGTTSTGTVSADSHGGLDVSVTHTYTQALDWWDSWSNGSENAASFRIVSIDVMDAKTGDEASARSLATVAPSSSSLTATSQNFTATAGTQFSGEVATFTDTTAGASAGDYTATINWGDATSSQGTVVADPNGGFDVSGTHTFAGDSDTGSDFGGFGRHGAHAIFSVTVENNTNSTTAVAFGLVKVASPTDNGTSTSSTSANELFVIQLYQSLLGRTPDVGGLASWTSLLGQGVGRTSVTAQLEQAPEYRTRQVESLYQTMLHRQADAGGLNGFLEMLANGGTLEQVQTLIAGSQEYFQSRGAGQASTYLQALYADALHRGIDATGQAAFGQMAADGGSRQAIAAMIFGSAEYHRDLVQNDYQTYLGRTADTGGLAAFVGGLQGGMTDESVAAAIIGSPEFFQRM